MPHDPNLNRARSRAIRRVSPTMPTVSGVQVRGDTTPVPVTSPPTLPRDPNNENPPSPKPPTGDHNVKELSADDKEKIGVTTADDDPDKDKDGMPVSKAADSDDKDKDKDGEGKGSKAEPPGQQPQDDDDDDDGGGNGGSSSS